MDKLFVNPGEKIRSYALGLFFVMLAVAAISAFATFVLCCLELGVVGALLGLFLMVIEFAVTVLGAYITCLFITAFGDLVHNTAVNAELNNQILISLKTRSSASGNNASAQQVPEASKRPAEAVPSQSSANTVPPQPINADKKSQTSAGSDNVINDTYWVCGNCHTKNLNSRDDCWACGNKK